MAACLLMTAKTAYGQFDFRIVPERPGVTDNVVLRYTMGDFCTPEPTHRVTINGNDIEVREMRPNQDGCRPMFFDTDVPLGQLAPGTYTVRYYIVASYLPAPVLRDTITFAVLPAPIPTASELGLAAAVIVLALSGVLVLRR